MTEAAKPTIVETPELAKVKQEYYSANAMIGEIERFKRLHTKNYEEKIAELNNRLPALFEAVEAADTKAKALVQAQMAETTVQ